MPGSTLINKLQSRPRKYLSPLKQMPGTVTHHSDLRGHHPVLLTTSQVKIVSADGSTPKSRALLDSASSILFITEGLAQHLLLRRRRHSMKVGGIDGSATRLSSCGMVDLNISSICENTLAVEAVVLPKFTTNLPSRSVPFNRKWKHLLNICLADPDFGTPGSVDQLLEADVFSHTMLHGWQFGPSGPPSAFKTSFGWVLVGATHMSSHSN